MSIIPLIYTQASLFYTQIVSYLGIAGVPLGLQVLSLSVLVLVGALFLGLLGYMAYHSLQHFWASNKTLEAHQDTRKILKKTPPKISPWKPAAPLSKAEGPKEQAEPLQPPPQKIIASTKNTKNTKENDQNTNKPPHTPHMKPPVFELKILKNLIFNKNFTQLAPFIAANHKKINASIMQGMLEQMLLYFNDPKSLKSLIFLFISCGLHTRVFETQDTMLSLMLKINSGYYYPTRFQALEFLINRLSVEQLNAPDAQGNRALDYIGRHFITKPEDRINDAKLINLLIAKGARPELMSAEIITMLASANFLLSSYGADEQAQIQEAMEQIKPKKNEIPALLNDNADSSTSVIPRELSLVTDLPFTLLPVQADSEEDVPLIVEELSDLQQVQKPLEDIKALYVLVEKKDITNLKAIDALLEKVSSYMNSEDIGQLLNKIVVGSYSYSWTYTSFETYMSFEFIPQCMALFLKHDLHARIFDENETLLLLLFKIERNIKAAAFSLEHNRTRFEITRILMNSFSKEEWQKQLRFKDSQGNTVLYYALQCGAYAEYGTIRLLLDSDPSCDRLISQLKVEGFKPSNCPELAGYLVKKIILQRGDKDLCTLFDDRAYAKDSIETWLLADLFVFGQQNKLNIETSTNYVFEFFLPAWERSYVLPSF